jgi:hypothetical protein
MNLRFQPYNQQEVNLILHSIRENHVSLDKVNQRSVMHSIPHKVYQLNKKDIIHEKGLRSALFNGQQYFITENEKIIGVAEIVSLYKQDHSIRLNYGSDYSLIPEIIKMIEEHQQQGEFEFTILRIPSINVKSVWLRAVNKSFFVPFGELPKEYSSSKLYSEEDFFRLAKRLSLISINF